VRWPRALAPISRGRLRHRLWHPRLACARAHPITPPTSSGPKLQVSLPSSARTLSVRAAIPGRIHSRCRLCRGSCATSIAGALVLAGDLNTSPWSSGFRRRGAASGL